MTGNKTTGEKTLMLFSGRAHPALADEVAFELDIAVSPTQIRDFADGEIYSRFEESVRGCDAFVIQSMTTPVNQWLMETLIMCDALKRGSAKRITMVVPYYPYARQDKKRLGREPISARLIADLYKTAGADRILTVDLHTSQIQGFFDGPVDHLFALPLLADYIADRYDPDPARGRRPGLRPGARRGALDRAARRRTAGLHPQDPRHQRRRTPSSRTASSVRSRAAPASSSTT